MKLWVVRHAVAMERGDYHAKYGRDAADELRPLTEIGAKKMRVQAKGLRVLLPRPEYLIASPLTRALQTSEILQSAWPRLSPLFCEALTPDGSPRDFVQWCKAHLRRSDLENADLVIVGHNPGLPILLRYLITGEETTERDAGIDLKKGGVCCLEFSTGVKAGEGQMLGLLTPKILRALATLE